MKPQIESSSLSHGTYAEERGPFSGRFPRIDYCLQSGFDLSYGCSFPFEDGNRRFHNLSRQFLAESASEQKREFIVLGLILLVSAWPVVSMVITVVELYSRHHP